MFPIGLEDEGISIRLTRFAMNDDLLIAVAAVREMVHASNFSKKMLLLATRLANEAGLKGLLLSVLHALLDVSIRDGVDSQAESITLIRCIIRLVLRTMSEPAADL